jgi:hypothetical protein
MVSEQNGLAGLNMPTLEVLSIKNPYVRRARLQPALIVTLPVSLAILAWSPGDIKSWTPLWSLIVGAGGTSLLAQVARDLGKQKEQALYVLWGGKPTTRLLRYRGSDNAVLVTLRHKTLQTVIPDLLIPDEAEESANPKRSDDIYDACVRRLLELTRDAKKFPLVFEENCNYGFRRNLWGMRKWAIVINIMGIVACIPHLKSVSSGTEGAMAYGAVGCIVCLLLFWLFVCTSDWVRTIADAFAERLLASGDILATLPTGSVKNLPPTKKQSAPARKRTRTKGEALAINGDASEQKPS